MVSWNVAIGLMVIAFAMPFIFLRSQLAAMLRHARHAHAELERLRAESHELEEHVERDKALFLEALGVPFLLLRSSGRLVMGNRAAACLLGVDVERKANLLKTVEDEELREMLTRAAQTESPFSATLTLHRGGEERVFRTTATPLSNEERHIGIVFHDITEEHRTQIIRRDFVANASHELRTPMTIIRGYLETLLEDASCAQDEAFRTRSLTLMKKHADRTMRLVEDMLLLSRLEDAGGGYLRMESLELGQVVDDVRLQLEGMLGRQQASLELDLQPTPFPMRGDRFYWSQIFFNLLENALKNNPSPGLHLCVRARRADSGAVCIAVEDDGIGIVREALPYIFNRFYRADASGKVKGTGLGLSIVRHAVEAHGGHIRVESEPGIRTAFVMEFPADAAAGRDVPHDGSCP